MFRRIWPGVIKWRPRRLLIALIAAAGLSMATMPTSAAQHDHRSGDHSDAPSLLQSVEDVLQQLILQQHHSGSGSSLSTGQFVGGANRYLLGVDHSQSPWSTYTGRNPMIGGCGGFSGISGTGYAPKGCAPYPMLESITTHDSPAQAHDAARGKYNHNYARTLAAAFDLYAQYIYYIVIDNEWPPTWNRNGPFGGPGGESRPQISKSDWVAMEQNMINAIRADHNLDNVKIALYAPYDDASQAYAAGVTGYDMLSQDIYVGHAGETTEAQAFAHQALPLLNSVDSFANSVGKPYAITEWCTWWTNNNGYSITAFANWFNTHNVVSNTYWDSDYNAIEHITYGPVQGTFVCTLDADHSRVAAYTAAFKGYTYTGSFWPVIIPWP